MIEDKGAKKKRRKREKRGKEEEKRRRRRGKVGLEKEVRCGLKREIGGGQTRAKRRKGEGKKKKKHSGYAH